MTQPRLKKGEILPLGALGGVSVHLLEALTIRGCWEDKEGHARFDPRSVLVQISLLLYQILCGREYERGKRNWTAAREGS